MIEGGGKLKNPIINFILLFILFSCDSTEESRKKGNSSNSISKEEDKSEVVTTEENSNSSDPDIIELPNSGEVNAEDIATGISVFAPKGLIQENVTPQLQIKPLRNIFNPSNGVVLLSGEGTSTTIELKDNSDALIDSKKFSDNYSVAIPFEKSSDIDLNKLGVVVRNSDSGNEEIRILPPSTVQIDNSSQNTKAKVTFKVGSPSTDIQLIQLDNDNLSASDVYIPKPVEVKGLQCNAASPYSISLSWGMLGGFSTAFKIIYGTNQETITNDLGCTANSSIADLTGVTLSYTKDQLQPDTTYYFRICSKNSRYPIPDSSPGIICSVKTPTPDIPIIHLAFDYIGKVYYGVNSGNGWPSPFENIFDYYQRRVESFEFDNTNQIPYITYSSMTTGQILLWSKTSVSQSVQICCSNESIGTVGVMESSMNPTSLKPQLIRYRSYGSTSSYSLNYENNAWTGQSGETDTTKIPPFGPESNAYTVDNNGEEHLVKITSTGSGSASGLYIKTTNKLWPWSIGQYTTTNIRNPDCTGDLYTPKNEVDSNNKIHMIYYCKKTNNECSLYYETNKSGTFERTPVFNASNCRNMFDSGLFDFVLDKNNHIYISIADISNASEGSCSPRICGQDIYLADKNLADSTFSITQLSDTPTDQKIYKVNIAVDDHEKHHVVYSIFDSNSSVVNLKYLTNLSGQEAESTIDTKSPPANPTDYPYYNILGIRTSGMPHH